MLWFENDIKLSSHELEELMGNSVLEIYEEIEMQQMCYRAIEYSPNVQSHNYFIIEIFLRLFCNIYGSGGIFKSTCLMKKYILDFYFLIKLIPPRYPTRRSVQLKRVVKKSPHSDQQGCQTNLSLQKFKLSPKI